MKINNRYAAITILLNPETELYHWKHIKEESIDGHDTN